MFSIDRIDFPCYLRRENQVIPYVNLYELPFCGHDRVATARFCNRPLLAMAG